SELSALHCLRKPGMDFELVRNHYKIAVSREFGDGQIGLRPYGCRWLGSSPGRELVLRGRIYHRHQVAAKPTFDPNDWRRSHSNEVRLVDAAGIALPGG